MEILIYTKPGCGFCTKAKNWLKLKNYSYTEVELNDPNLLAKFRKNHPELKTVPQIFATVDGQQTHIGGYTELIKHELFADH